MPETIYGGYPEVCSVCVKRFDDSKKGKEAWDVAEYKVYELTEPYTRKLKRLGVPRSTPKAAYCSVECLREHFTLRDERETRWFFIIPYPRRVQRWVHREEPHKYVVHAKDGRAA